MKDEISNTEWQENFSEDKNIKTPILSFGEKLVGLTFNPSGDDKVAKAKKLCADLMDLVEKEYNSREAGSKLDGILYQHTVGEILNAQMNVVKVLTLRY